MARASDLEERTQAIGRELFELAHREHQHLSQLNRWAKAVVAWCVSDRQVKTRVLRFIDCLPTLQTPHAIVQHLRDYFPPGSVRLPLPLQIGVSLARPGLITAPAVAFAVHQLVEQVARQFIAASTPEDAAQVWTRLTASGCRVSFDVLGEQVTSEHEADAYVQQYHRLLDVLQQAAGTQHTAQLHLSVKPSGLSSHFDPLSFELSLQQALKRLMPLAEHAAAIGAAITLDMEQYEYCNLTLALAKQLLTSTIGSQIRLGIVIQAYLCDAETVVEELVGWLSRHERRLAIRLVKGAYWDYEVAVSRQRGWSSPVWMEKRQTDAAFERLTERLLQRVPHVRVEIGSHNLRSLAHAMAAAHACGMPADQVEYQVLYGMGDVIASAIRTRGSPVRIYAPVGAFIPGMAYLVRRLLENTANDSFLRQDLWNHATMDALLASPDAPR